MANATVKCSACGRDFLAPEESAQVYCVHCGKKNSRKPKQIETREKRVVPIDILLKAASSSAPSTGTERVKKPVLSTPVQQSDGQRKSQHQPQPDSGLKRLSELDTQMETSSLPPDDGYIEQFIEQCQCPVCNTIVSPDAPRCPACGVQFAEEEEPAEREAKDSRGQKPLNICGSCGRLAPDLESLYTCTQCRATFCDSCPTPRSPPEPAALDARVEYRYKFKNQSVWKADVVKIDEKIPVPLCRRCYLSQYDKAFLRLRSRVKQWEIDMRRDTDIKIIEEKFPVRKEVVKTRNIIPAQDFLKWVAKG